MNDLHIILRAFMGLSNRLALCLSMTIKYTYIGF